MNAEAKPDGLAGMRLIKSGYTPGHRTRILIVDRDPSAVAVIRSIFRAQDWEVISAKTAAEALEKVRTEGPDAIVMEYNLADMNGVDLCRTLRQRAETANTPIIVLSASTGVAERVASLRAGATDYLVKPPDAQEMIARLKAALDLRKEKAGFIVAVVGSKGGVGTTVVATNLATALRRVGRNSVVLLDAAKYGGAVDIMLNLPASTAASRVLPNLEDLEPSDYESILTSHVSGLQILLLHQQVSDIVSPAEMRKALIALRRIRDMVVIDTCPVIDENTETILELCDRVLLVLTPEITSLRGAKHFLEQTTLMGLARERVVPVLNRFPLRGGLQRRDIENALGVSMQMTIPDDVKLVTYSVNRGVPIVGNHERSGVARQVGELAKGLLKIAQQV